VDCIVVLTRMPPTVVVHLTAVVAADVAGDSRLMDAGEEGINFSRRAGYARP